MLTTNVTATHVFQHNNKAHEVLPATIVKEPTNEQKIETLEYMQELKDIVAKLARDIIIKKYILYASDALKWERPDGQPISTYTEVRNIASWKTIHGTVDEKKQIWNMVFDGNFEKGWEHTEEMLIMRDQKMDYRPWVSQKTVKKGFVARILSKELNIKRKDFTGYIRRTKAEHDEEGNPIRRRNKHSMEFDPTSHCKTMR